MFTGRNECLETHCSLIVKGDKEKTVPARSARTFEVKGKKDRVRVRDEKRNGRLFSAADTSGELADGQASAEKFEQTGPAELESGLIATK